MPNHRVGRAVVGVVMLGLVVPLAVGATTTSAAAAIRKPPVNGKFDYQIGGGYQPATGVSILDRDRTDRPLAGKYNICYVNAFQVQPGELSWWKKHHSRLLLRKAGRLVVDQGWNEVLLDVSTAAKRRSLATVVNRWVDGCARKGFQAVEFDNLDSYSRSKGRLRLSQDLAFAKQITKHAHSLGLAVGQKNTAELGARGKTQAKFDFAIVEECQRYLECDQFLQVFGNHVIEIEYTDYPSVEFAAACRARGSHISIVRRDRNLTRPGNTRYAYQAC